MRSLEGVLVFTLTSGLLDVELQPGSAELSVTIPRNQLRSGRYTLDLYLLTAQPQDYLLSAKTFEVVVSREPGGDPRRVRDNLGLVTRRTGVGSASAGDAEPSLRSVSILRTTRSITACG